MFHPDATTKWARWGYPILFGLLMMLFVMHPWAARSDAGETAIELVYTAILVGCLVAVADGKRLVLLGIVVVIPAVFLMYFGGSSRQAAISGGAIGCLFLAIVIAAILRHVFRQSRVTVHSVLGALSAFLLMGVLWDFLYVASDAALEDAFEGLSSNPGMRDAQLFYFSFVTLTTLGYGDVTPARPETMSLAMVEAITGQAYLVVLVAYLVARLVSEHSRGS